MAAVNVSLSMDEVNALVDEVNRYQGDVSLGRNRREASLELAKIKLLQALAAAIEGGAQLR